MERHSKETQIRIAADHSSASNARRRNRVDISQITYRCRSAILIHCITKQILVPDKEQGTGPKNFAKIHRMTVSMPIEKGMSV